MMQQHVVGFDVIDARNLVTEDGNPCDPFVVVSCCGRFHETKVKEEKLSQVLWNESHKWADVEFLDEEFRSATIEFAVYARYFFSRNYLIGKATLQLLQINKRKGHLLANRAVPLRREGSAQTTGILNLSVFCLRPGESVPSWNADEAPDHEDERDLTDISRAVLGAPDRELAAEQGNPFHLLVNIFRVEGLAKIYGRYPSPFITVEFAGTFVRTDPAWDVEHYAWNECARFPVMPPVYEDTIVLKLWSAGTGLSADMLLAQGFLSFSELRNRPIAARWFNLYGWNPEEVPSAAGARQTGDSMKANFFIGRLLVGARVAPVDNANDLQPAGLDPARARTAVEPAMDNLALLIDVFEVSGALGRECRVEVQFGRHVVSTPDWVVPSAYSRDREGVAHHSPQDPDDGVVQVDTHELEDLTTFTFGEREGRMEPLVAMCPHDLDSQPDVMINVYTRGVLSGDRRIAYGRLRVSDFQELEIVNGVHAPARPRYVPLELLPGTRGQRVAPAVLMSLERHDTDGLARGARRKVHTSVYCVRAYVFMARNIKADRATSSAVRVSCAGVSKATKLQQGPRPTWMTPVELKVTLQSDQASGGNPTMEPIQLTLLNQSTDVDLGKAVCRYEHLRHRRDSDGFRLEPQWINLYGGSHNSRVMGQVLVAFELLLWRHAEDDPRMRPKAMWPQALSPLRSLLGAALPTENAPFSRLRKATLYFALHGLRDLVAPSGALPEVIVRIKSFAPEDHESLNEEKGRPKPGRFYTMRFRKEIQSKNQLLEWKTDALGHTDCSNFEMLEVKRMCITVPDNHILQPYMSVEVREQPKPGMFGILTKGAEGALIGEHLRGLNKLLPCSWYKGVTMSADIAKQEALIRDAVSSADKQAHSRETYQEPARRLEAANSFDSTLTPESSTIGLLADRQPSEDLISRQETARPGRPSRTVACDCSGLPEELLGWRKPKSDKQGRAELRKPLLTADPQALNMERKRGFGSKCGRDEPLAHPQQDKGRPVVHKGLEQQGASGNKEWVPDFSFQNRPLLRGCDSLDVEEEEPGTDWNFQHGRCFGFVKYVAKLVDGWDGWDDDDVEDKEDL